MTSIMTADLLAAESLCFIIYLFVTASTSTGECHDDDDAMTARPPTAPIADSKIASRSRAKATRCDATSKIIRASMSNSAMARGVTVRLAGSPPANAKLSPRPGRGRRGRHISNHPRKKILCKTASGSALRSFFIGVMVALLDRGLFARTVVISRDLVIFDLYLLGLLMISFFLRTTTRSFSHQINKSISKKRQQ